MKECFSHADNEFRCYHGFDFEIEESENTLLGKVRDNLLDSSEMELFIGDLAGLNATGFDSERILIDMQAIATENPNDSRDWRIGEAFAEIVLESSGARFHWNEIRDTRNPNGNKTGADLVGFIETINGEVLFLFGEVKTSSELSRPPQVMTASGQMEDQLKDLYKNQKKRQILIRYLASKVRNLDETNQFKQDYNAALRSYYLKNHPNYQLTGVLIRDIEQDEMDLKGSFIRLKETILTPTGIRLLACYIPIKKTEWAKKMNRTNTSQ